jgi:hypothetical protein
MDYSFGINFYKILWNKYFIIEVTLSQKVVKYKIAEVFEIYNFYSDCFSTWDPFLPLHTPYVLLLF